MKRENNDTTYLTPHFTLEELTRTNAKDKDWKRLPNVPPYNALKNLQRLARDYLKDSNFPYHELFLCYRPKTQTYWVHLSFKETAYQNALNCKLLSYK